MNKIVTTILAATALIAGAVSMSALQPTSAQATNCIDINNPHNIYISWPDKANKPGTVKIQAAKALPVCESATLWFSSYTLPKNYDNSGWFGVDPNGVSHPTSYPQAAYAHTRIDIKAGTLLNGTYTVKEVNLCNTAAQYDVYHRAEKITSIKTEKGIFEHSGVKYASGFVAIKDTSEKCNPKPVTPVTPAPVTPTPVKPTPVTPTPVKPVVVKPVVTTPVVSTPVAETPVTTVTELPTTGAGSTTLVALALGVVTAGVTYLVRRSS